MRAPRLALDPVAARYLRCIKGGQAAGTGVPDGDGRLSIVMNKRYLTVLRPVGGTIRFIIGFCPAGSITLLRGTTDTAKMEGSYATQSSSE